MRWQTRTIKEVRQRVSQELRNLYLWTHPPTLRTQIEFPTPLHGLPNPQTIRRFLRGSPFPSQIAALAESIRRHHFPILGFTIDTGPEIHWRRDYCSGRESDLRYFRRVPYLDALRVGDHKVVWELNRHQHLVVLAQDYLLNQNDESLAEIVRQLGSWFEQNPFARGMNWTSALEVAFRALSWIWVWHLAGQALPSTLRRQLIEEIYRHGCYLETNLSFYFSPNTHLLGEAVALYTLGRLFPFPTARRWTEKGAAVVQRQMQDQVREDGSHFEQSAYYHVYALDMFLFYFVLSGDASIREKLIHMAEYLDALLGPARQIPLLGDDDGGRFFHPYGVHAQYGRATLATCAVLFGRGDWSAESEDLAPQGAWWLEEPKLPRSQPIRRASRLFADAGIASMIAGNMQIIVDVGGLAKLGAGHSHSDSLSLIARTAEREILIDPGSYTYRDDEQWRDHFRGTAAHNTVRIDGLDQGVPAGPFRWTSAPEVVVREWIPGSSADIIEAECRYRGFVHVRRVVFVKCGLLLVADTISGADGEHDIEQFWHLGSSVGLESFCFSETPELMKDWRSTAYGRKTQADVLRVSVRTKLPCRIVAGVAVAPGKLTVQREGTMFRFTWNPPEGESAEWRL